MLFNTIIWLCSGLYYYTINFFNSNLSLPQDVNDIRRSIPESHFEVVYQWNYLNYTWTSPDEYNKAIENGRYIPANNAPTGIKFYRNRMFLTIPRFRQGIPVTLVYLDTLDGQYYENPLLTPYPNWPFNDDVTSCSNLQSVQSMEVDSRGVMWIIDGVRINNYTRCPSKLILLDLNNDGVMVHKYVFPERLATRFGGFLNDIVVDETDGDFAYITDNSQTDPGIIVYSRRKDKSWKLRDKSMLPEPNAVPFKVEHIIFDNAAPVDGIALSPRKSNTRTRTLYYCAISSFTIYSISTKIIKNSILAKSGRWRRFIHAEGRKSSQSDGIIIDELDNMFLTMLPDYGVATWNIKKPFSTMEFIDINRKTMVWPDGFAFDQKGYLYLISNKIYNYIDLRRTPIITNDIPFRILRSYTGSRSYLYSYD